jgi:hypothetical protein
MQSNREKFRRTFLPKNVTVDEENACTRLWKVGIDATLRSRKKRRLVGILSTMLKNMSIGYFNRRFVCRAPMEGRKDKTDNLPLYKAWVRRTV